MSFPIYINQEPKNIPEIIQVTSPKKNDVYKIGNTINIHFSNPLDIPKDSLQIVFIVGSTNGFAVKDGLATGVTDNFKFTIPSESCGEDTCVPVETGKYKVTAKIYSKDVFKLGCIKSEFCAYPDSDLIANGQSDEFIIDTSSK